MVRKLVVLAVMAVAPLCVSAEGLNDYPTMDRVNYVLDCMDRHGGPRIETLTGCSCEMDQVGGKMSYTEFVDANVYMQHRDMPGDKGGVFRDMPQGKDGFAKLEAARVDAEKICYVEVREVKRKGDAEKAAADGTEAAPAAN
jgi:hypothetical protein